MDENKGKYIEYLKELVEIPSVSAWPENRSHIVKVCEIVAKVGSPLIFHFLTQVAV